MKTKLSDYVAVQLYVVLIIIIICLFIERRIHNNYLT